MDPYKSTYDGKVERGAKHHQLNLGTRLPHLSFQLPLWIPETASADVCSYLYCVHQHFITRIVRPNRRCQAVSTVWNESSGMPCWFKCPLLQLWSSWVDLSFQLLALWRWWSRWCSSEDTSIWRPRCALPSLMYSSPISSDYCKADLPSSCCTFQQPSVESGLYITHLKIMQMCTQQLLTWSVCNVLYTILNT